jgi:RHS repeat-associated protein
VFSGSAADLDTDGDVDLNDFAIFMRIFGANPGVRYVWNAENRLVNVVPGFAADGSRDPKVMFAYDHLGRRVRKQVFTWNGNLGTWTGPTKDVKYVYDGWRVIMELDGLNSDAVTRKYAWGLDLAGQSGQLNSVEGAGGIGGLLATTDTAGTTATADDRTFIYTHDANGNVSQIIETTAGDPGYGHVAAHYEYTLYGQRLNAPAAEEYDQPYRFSTKPFDEETGLGYWGYRYYSLDLGRWLSRDPIGVRGGLNIYRYVDNSPTTSVDFLGLDAKPAQQCSYNGQAVVMRFCGKLKDVGGHGQLVVTHTVPK